MSAPSGGLADVGAGVLAASGDLDDAVRAVAGRFLVTGLGDPQVDRALRHLVDDAGNTAVSREVACALVAGGGAAGLRLALSCLGDMDRCGAAAYWVYEGMSQAWSEQAGAGERAILALVDDVDPQVVAGARWVRGQWQWSRATPAPRRRRWRWR